jgi:hypothetical protein
MTLQHHKQHETGETAQENPKKIDQEQHETGEEKPKPLTSTATPDSKKDAKP